MRIKMLTAEGSMKKGEVYDLDDKQAAALLTVGKAVRVKVKPAEAVEAPKPQSKAKKIRCLAKPTRLLWPT